MELSSHLQQLKILIIISLFCVLCASAFAQDREVTLDTTTRTFLLMQGIETFVPDAFCNQANQCRIFLRWEQWDSIPTRSPRDGHIETLRVRKKQAVHKQITFTYGQPTREAIEANITQMLYTDAIPRAYWVFSHQQNRTIRIPEQLTTTRFTVPRAQDTPGTNSTDVPGGGRP